MVSLVAGLALLGSASPFAFGEEPDAAAFREGVDLWRAGKGIERTLGPERAVLAVWFDGRIRQAADVAVWVSPKLVSRRLGYLSASRRMTAEQVLSAWREAADRLDGRLAFAVRLCALRRRGWDGEEGPPADGTALRSALWLLTSGPGLPERHRQPDALPWEPTGPPAYRSAPSAEWPFQTEARPAEPLWMGAFREARDALALDPLAVCPASLGQARAGCPSPLGGNFVALFWLEAPTEGLRLHPEGFELRLLVGGRERVAAFRWNPVGRVR